MTEVIARILVARRRLLAGIALLLMLSAIPAAMRLELNRSLESLYPPNSPRLQAYRAGKKAFGGDAFVIVAWKQPNLFNERGLLTRSAAANIGQLADLLSQVPGVNASSTQSLKKVLDNAVAFAQNVAKKEYGGGTVAQIFASRMAVKQQPKAREFSRGILLGADNATTAIVLRLKPEESTPVPRAKTFRRIREIVHNNDSPAYVAGAPVQIFDAFQYVDRDSWVLFYGSLGLLSVVLLVLFRSLRWVLLPLLVTAASIFWTRAILWLAGVQLSMVSSILNSIVMIIAVATCTHLAVRYRLRRRELERNKALRASYRELLAPIFWAVATTVAGFLSLIVSDVVPVESFGLMCALGTGLVFVAVLLLTPAGAVVLTPDSQRGPRGRAPRPSRLSHALGGLTSWALRWRWPIFVVTAVLAMLSAFGLTQLTVETDFSENFREESPISQSVAFVEKNLGGAGVWGVNFPAPAKLTPDYLEKVRTLAGQLRELRVDGEPALTKVIALTDGLDMLPDSIASDNPNENLDLISQLQPEFVATLYNPEAGRMRIMLRSYVQQPAGRKRATINAVQATTAAIFPEAQTTGLFVLLTYLIQSLLRNQLVSFAIATGSIVAMMLIAFRSIRLAAVALVPNVLPNLVLIGAMGLLGIPINIGTAMIASVSIGLTIDSSIHYFTSFRRYQREGRDTEEALRETGRQVGVALVFATIALSAGFSVLVFSSFVPLIYFGVLVSLAMLGGLLGNLLLLPALVSRGSGKLKTPTLARNPIR